jgi:hypothetical protein
MSRHAENYYIDFDRERLLPHLLSMEGPHAAAGDVDGDGLEDIFVTGGKGDSGKLFLQRNNRLVRSLQQGMDKKNNADQVGSALFDADGDKDLDLLVAYGGNEDAPGSAHLKPALYLNNGKGNFTEALERLPGVSVNASCVRAADVDTDGDMDLFIGGRSVPGQYGFHPKSFLLMNNGSGHFTDETAKRATSLQEAGMVTDAAWTDVDGDGRPDLVIVGEWMPVTVFFNREGKLQKQETAFSEGWWNCVKTADIDGDGDQDLLLGNLGLNSKIKSDQKHPAELYINDFDNNGQTETVLAYYKADGKAYLLHSKPELTTQMPELRKKLLKYADYAGKTAKEVFDAAQLKGAQVKKAYQLQNCLAINDGKGNFLIKPLPLRAQFSPIYAFVAEDLDGDNKLDLLCGGNFFGAIPEIGRYDAGYTTFLKGDGKGDFTFIPNTQTGITIRSEIREIIKLKMAKDQVLLFVKNNEPVDSYRQNF